MREYTSLSPKFDLFYNMRFIFIQRFICILVLCFFAGIRLKNTHLVFMFVLQTSAVNRFAFIHRTLILIC